MHDNVGKALHTLLSPASAQYEQLELFLRPRSPGFHAPLCSRKEDLPNQNLGSAGHREPGQALPEGLRTGSFDVPHTACLACPEEPGTQDRGTWSTCLVNFPCSLPGEPLRRAS